MKTIIITLLAMALLLPISATAKDDTVQWQVKISVTYNAVDREDARRIADQFMREHEDACKAEVQIEKVNSSNSIMADAIIYWGDTAVNN